MLTLLLAIFTFVELNCENLFDIRHDEGKQDTEYLPDATRHWTKKRYWRKLNQISQELLSCSEEGVPDMIALCEVENDSVLLDLTRRSLLRNAGYEYVSTQSPDVRGIDVALLYSPFSFRLLNSYSLRVTPVEGMRPTRDILYVEGQVISGDTLHVFVVHAPSRYGGERHSRPFRLAVADRLCASLDSLAAIHPDARVLIAGDFNDPADAPALQRIYTHAMQNISREAQGEHGVKGTYRYQGEWESIDHLIASNPLYRQLEDVRIHSPLFLLEKETVYGDYRPRRTYHGFRYQGGYSDHLPLVARFRW